MSVYEKEDQPLFDRWNAEVRYLDGRTWLCMQQECDGINHWYQNVEDLS